MTSDYLDSFIWAVLGLMTLILTLFFVVWVLTRKGSRD